MPVPVATKRRVHYPLLIYHGCVRTRADVLTFREHFDDFAGQVRHLLRQGYTFVSPSDYLAWYNGTVTPPGPIACIHIDDGLASISTMCDWLVEQGIPFGLAIIGRRQRKHEPEPDFASWQTLRDYVDTGLCELLNHTYNHHHLIPVYDKGAVQSGPVMSAPAWVDVGDPVHVAPGDTRPAWDFSHVDSLTWGLPLYGSDPFDDFATPITTTLRITPKWSGNVAILRLWQALGRPFGTPREAGYDANVRIEVRGAPTLQAVPPAVVPYGLTYWFAHLTRTAQKIVLIGDSTTAIAPELYTALHAGTAPLLQGSLFINRGNEGATTADWLAGNVPNPPSVCYADAADLYVVSFGLDDVRQGGVDQSTLASRLAAIVDALRANVPGATVLLRMPNSMLSTDPTQSGLVEPLSAAQNYTDIIRGAYLALAGAWPDSSTSPGVAVWDAMSAIFGTTCPESSPLMRDILQPNDAGYAAIGQAIANLIVPAGWTETGGTAWTQVWDGVISPVDYGTRQQWVAREFYSITLDTAFAVTSGAPIDIRFTTLNAGYGCAVLYMIPDLSGQHWAVTTTRALTAYPAPVPDAVWPTLTDFPAGYPWPGRPAIILASTAGAAASDADYEAYVRADLQANNAAIQTWLRANWTTHAQAYVGDDSNLGTAELAGATYAGVPITTRVPFDCPATHTAEVLRWRNAGPSGDERYPNIIEISLSTNATGPWTVLATYASRWQHYKWEEVDIPPTPLVAGTRYWVRFRSLIANPWGRRAVQRILIDRVTDLAADAEWPQGVHAYLETLSATPGAAPAPNQLAYPFGSYMDNGAGSVVVSKTQEVGAPLQAALVAAGCDLATTIYPARYEPATGLFREPGARYSRYTLGRHLIYGTAPPLATLSGIDAYAGTRYADAPHGGIRWQTSVEPDPAGNATVRHSVAALDWVSFDAWFFDGAGGIARGALNDGGTYLGITPLSGTFTPGETLTESGSGATASLVWAEPTIGVMRVTGVSGAWTGGATVTGGTSGATAIGDIPGPTPYADDKGWLQARGVRCLLILNNNLATGAPDSAIGSHVVNNPSTYIPQIVAAAVDNGWDGITCNLEAVPAADRAAASAFYAQLAAALHAQRKHLIATAPATTGTDYDADWWTGWCDHNALAAVCDAVKILTYTETGPGTAPGSASPDWHFEATVEYLRYHVYAPLWPRLLLGARAFGHLWADRADPNSADYVTYADALAQGMLLGAEIQQADGEGYWRQGARECWFGSPETIRRAVRRASAIGFGGVGIWKADDGDLYEHWPEWPQIGVDDMAAFSEERFPDDWAWFAVGGPRYKTYITAGDSDYEARVGVGDLGLRRYTLSRELHTQAEVDFFLSFWQLRRGPLEGFRLRDWRDYTATGQGLGVGDGLLTGFQLVKRYANTDPVTGASSSYQRTITKPRPGTVQVYLDGVQQSSGYTVDHATGLISFSTPPASGVTVTASCEFDVPVRFEQDEPPLQFDPQFGLAQLSGLRLVEVRP